MELTSGASLQGGKYRIISSLGQGGFGITYLAEHTTLGAHVCIKEFFIKDFCNRSDDGSVISVVSENSRADIDGFKRKFLDEARKLYKIKHNHIVSVTDLFEENNTAYYVMDYIEGETLQSRINREGALRESDARRYICEVAEALRYIHENSMLHLDIKPGNIMVRSNGDTAIVIDFGLAKHYDPETGHQTTTYLGAQSPGYAPFEQGLSGGGVKMFCPATDIYSLGATLFALVTGVRPPEAAAIPNEGLPELPAHLMPSTREAITRAMEYGIKSRPQSIDEFLSIINAQSANVHQHAADIVVTPLADSEATRVTASTSNGSSTTNIEHGVDALTIKRQYRRELILVLSAASLGFVLQVCTPLVRNVIIDYFPILLAILLGALVMYRHTSDKRLNILISASVFISFLMLYHRLMTGDIDSVSDNFDMSCIYLNYLIGNIDLSFFFGIISLFFVTHTHTRYMRYNIIANILFLIVFYLSLIMLSERIVDAWLNSMNSLYSMNSWYIYTPLILFIAFAGVKSFLLYREQSYFSASILLPLIAFIPLLITMMNLQDYIDYQDYYYDRLDMYEIVPYITFVLWSTIYLYVKRNIQLSKLQ